MRYLYLILLALLPLSIFSQDLIHSSHYHMESIDCPEDMVCESRTGYRRKLIFFQIFNKEGKLHSEYLRTDDSTFLYKSFYLMDHFDLIRKPSFYGQKSSGFVRISNSQIGAEKEAYDYYTYEAYNYHDTLLMPIGNWMVRNFHGGFQERVSFNDDGQLQGTWHSYRDKFKTKEQEYTKGSLISINYVDEMAKEPESRELIKKLQGTWYVNLKWGNKQGGLLAIGSKKSMGSLKHSTYTILDNELKVQSFEKGKQTETNETYQLSVKDDKYLVLKNKDTNTELKVLYVSDTDFHLLPPKKKG